MEEKNERKIIENKAELLFKDRKYKEAKEEYLKNNQKQIDINILFKIAFCDTELKNYNDAIEYYKKILVITENKINEISLIKNNIAVCYLRLGKYEEAIKYYIEALKLNPDNSIYLGGLGDCYSYLNDYENTIFFYEQALQNNNKNIKVLRSLIVMFYRKEDYPTCLKYCNKLINIYKNNKLSFNENTTNKITIILAHNYKALMLYELKNKYAEIFIESFYNLFSLLDNCEIEEEQEKNKIYSDYYYVYSLIVHKINIDLAIKYIIKSVEYYNFYNYHTQLAIYYYLKSYEKHTIEEQEKYKENFYEHIKIARKLEKEEIENKIPFKTVKIPQNIFFEVMDEIEKTKEAEKIKEIQIEKEKERNKVIADVSHSIKNLIGGSIISPLNNYKKAIKENNDIRKIDEIIKGAEITKNIVNLMNSSFSGSIEYFYVDCKNTTNNNENIQNIIIDSLNYSIDNMFDWKNFPQFKEEYFPEKYIYIKSKEEFVDLNSFEKLQKFLNKNMFNFKYDFDTELLNYKISDENKSKTRLLLLFQEIIFNAVKYAAFIEKTRRFLNISFKRKKNEIIFTVENSCCIERVEKSTGIGKTAIENFCKIFNTIPVLKKENNRYYAIVKIPDFWKEKNE